MARTDRALRIGVDLGGTKTEAVVLRLEDEAPRVLARRRVATQRDAGYEHVVAATARLVADVARDAGLAAPPPIGVGMPGGITFRTPDGSRSDAPLVKNSNTTCLNGRPFRADLARALAGAFPAGAPFDTGALAFANDANCFALAEATYGATRRARVAFGAILGTGVGGGITLQGEGGVRAWDGAQGIAGEWGHVVLDPDAGRPCYCGRRGCVERYLSGPAIEQAYERRTGRPASVAAIVDARAADADARATVDDFIAAFGRALATVINVLDPDAIVLGGGVSNLPLLYDEGRAAVARWVFNDELRTPILQHTLGDSAGVLGAALVVEPAARVSSQQLPKKA
jgi:fructokinase